MKNQLLKNQPKYVNWIIWSIVIFLVYKFSSMLIASINTILETLGLTDTTEEKVAKKLLEEQQTATIDQNYWTTHFYRNHINAPRPTDEQLTKISNDIYNGCWTFWFNDYPQVLGAIKQIKSKVSISALCFIFRSTYKLDLFAFLEKYLDESQLKEILDYTNRLPLK